MKTGKLSSLEGTNYSVGVVRVENGDYEVVMNKPAHPDDPHIDDELELVATFYMHGKSKIEDLDRRINEIITDMPTSLVGEYAPTEGDNDD